MSRLRSVAKDAVLSADGRYRYRLIRRWDYSLPRLGWLMLNPSTADATVDDPTIRRCVDFAERWGYGGIVVRNLFALRATDPAELLAYPGDAVGPANLAHLQQIGREITVAAWGANKAVAAAWPRVESAFRGVPLVCLGTTKTGAPRHPLYVRADTEPQSFGGATTAHIGVVR